MYKDNKHKNRSVLGLVPYRHSNPPEITFRFYSANWMSNQIKKNSAEVFIDSCLQKTILYNESTLYIVTL